MVRAFLLGLVLLSACRKQDGDEHPPGTEGRALFAQYCAGCHGAQGDGNFLKGVPPNRETHLTRGQIVERVIHGTKHQKMPTFPKLKIGDAFALADFVLALQTRHEDNPVFWNQPLTPAPKSKRAP